MFCRFCLYYRAFYTESNYFYLVTTQQCYFEKEIHELTKLFNFCAVLNTITTTTTTNNNNDNKVIAIIIQYSNNA